MDLILPLSIVITMIMIYRVRLPTWILSDSLSTLLVGISLLFTPQVLLNFQSSIKLDLMSLHLARLLGLMFIASSVWSHRAFTTGNKQHQAAVILSRSIQSVMFLLSTTYAYFHYPEWNSNFAKFTLFASICWTLPNLWYSLITPSISSSENYNLVIFLLVDYAITNTLALTWFAFPQWILKLQLISRPNGICVTLARFIGASLAAQSSIVLSATSFSTLEAKKLVHVYRMLSCAVLLLIVVYGQRIDINFSKAYLVAFITVLFFWSFNSLLGYLVTSYIQSGHQEVQTIKSSSLVYHQALWNEYTNSNQYYCNQHF